MWIRWIQDETEYYRNKPPRCKEGMKIRLCHSQEVSFETKYTSNSSVFLWIQRKTQKFRERQFLIAKYTKLRYILLQLFRLINILKITKKIQGHTRHAIELLHPSFNLPTRLFCLQNCTGHLYSSQQWRGYLDQNGCQSISGHQHPLVFI